MVRHVSYSQLLLQVFFVFSHLCLAVGLPLFTVTHVLLILSGYTSLEFVRWAVSGGRTVGCPRGVVVDVSSAEPPLSAAHSMDADFSGAQNR
jgi:hypothetical protein